MDDKLRSWDLVGAPGDFASLIGDDVFELALRFAAAREGSKKEPGWREDELSWDKLEDPLEVFRRS